MSLQEVLKKNHKLNNVNPLVNSAYNLGFYIIIEQDRLFFDHAKIIDLFKNLSLL